MAPNAEEMRVTQVKIVCQKWMEYGPGNARKEDGFTLHLTNEDRDKYIDTYWENLAKPTPEIYSAPYGTPYVALVDEIVVARIKARGCGQWLMGETPPIAHGYIYL